MSVQRIALVQEPAARTRAFEAAAEIAMLFQAELLGWFVEDIELLRFAGLPFAREIGALSATVRKLDPATMQRRLRSQAEQVRRALEASASGKTLRWSFRVARGPLREQLRAALDAAELVILSAATAGSELAALISAELAPSVATPALERLLRVSDRLEVVIFGADSQAAEKWWHEARVRFAGRSASLRMRRVADDEELALFLRDWRRPGRRC